MLAAAVGGSVAACAAAVPPPRCRSLCCRLMASALFGMRAAPSRRNGGPRPSSALPLNRARCGVPLRPPVPLLRRLARQRRRAAPPAGSRHPIFLEWWRLAPPGPLRRRRPVRRSCCGQPRQGGLLQRPLAAAPLRRRAPPLQPRPPVLAPGRGYFVFAAAGLGIAPPAGGAKGLPGCTRCAIGCGVHGFAMNPCESVHPATVPYSVRRV